MIDHGIANQLYDFLKNLWFTMVMDGSVYWTLIFMMLQKIIKSDTPHMVVNFKFLLWLLLVNVKHVRFSHSNSIALWSKSVTIRSLCCWYLPFKYSFIILGEKDLFCKEILLDISMLWVLVGIIFDLGKLFLCIRWSFIAIFFWHSLN